MQIGETKFIRTSFTGLDGRVVVAFTEDVARIDAFTIEVRPSGMKIKGVMTMEISSEGELQDFAKLLSDIWQEHRRIKPKLSTTLSGH